MTYACDLCGREAVERRELRKWRLPYTSAAYDNVTLDLCESCAAMVDAALGRDGEHGECTFGAEGKDD